MRAFLAGKKTYLVAVVLFIGGGLYATGHITKQQYDFVVALMAPLGVAAIRSAMN